jgi:hypothetical protein
MWFEFPFLNGQEMTRRPIWTDSSMAAARSDRGASPRCSTVKTQRFDTALFSKISALADARSSQLVLHGLTD